MSGSLVNVAWAALLDEAHEAEETPVATFVFFAGFLLVVVLGMETS